MYIKDISYCILEELRVFTWHLLVQSQQWKYQKNMSNLLYKLTVKIRERRQ